MATYGGFPSGGDPDWNDRDPNTYQTILSGDINTPDDANDNSYHVVGSTGADANTILDGFVVTAGNADGPDPNHMGGGMYNHDNSSPTVANSTFIRNVADAGGAMRNHVQSSPTITNCKFIGNIARSKGGGMNNYGHCNPVLTNCIFSGNDSLYYAGGMFNHNYSNPTLTNCVFANNSAVDTGGGIFNRSTCNPTVTNCIFWGNAAPTAAQIYSEAGSSPKVTYSGIQGGYSGKGNVSGDPCFVDANGADDIAGTEDDNLRLSVGSACIDDGNNAAVPAGVVTDLDGKARFADDALTEDGGYGTPPIVDMGAYEYEYSYFELCLVVDDMEDYNDFNRIGDTWYDWWWNGTGSEVYAAVDPCHPVHSGQQSMLYWYDNTGWFANDYYSEIEADTSKLQIGFDWSISDARILSLWFYGDASNDAGQTEQMYVSLEDSDACYAEIRYGDYGEDMNDIKVEEWQEWYVALRDFNDVNLADVQKVYIGFGDRENLYPGGTPGGVGVVYFDDIGLCPGRCVVEHTAVTDLSGNCVVNYRDLEIMADEWLSSGIKADIIDDNRVNAKDFALLARDWLKEFLWPPAP